MNRLEYQGYIGTIAVDVDERNLYGKILNIAGDVFYEGDTLDALEANMRAAIDAYLEMCAAEGIKPDAPFNGIMRVRVEPRTHARIAAEAESRGVPMNSLISATLNERFGTPPSPLEESA